MQHYSARTSIFKQRRLRILFATSLFLSLSIGFLIVPIERGAATSSIKTNFDGIWWAVSTLTTVGYGDVVPVTTLGRILGIILQILGALMFGIIVATIGATITRYRDEFYWNRLFERLDRMEDTSQANTKRTEYLVKDKTEDSNIA